MGPGGTETSVNINPSSPKLLLLKKLTAATGKGTNKAGYRGELGKPIREFTEAGDRDEGDRSPPTSRSSAVLGENSELSPNKVLSVTIFQFVCDRQKDDTNIRKLKRKKTKFRIKH